MSCRPALIAFALLALGGAGAAQTARPRPAPVESEGIRLLKASAAAAERLTYAGVRTVEFMADGELQRNVEIVTVQGPRSRTEFAAGSAWAGQIVVERDGRRYHFFPEANEIHVLPPRRDEARQGMLRLVRPGIGARLQVEVREGEEVADRPTTLLEMRDPRGNPVQRVWIDRETLLPLRRELVGPLGATVGRFRFDRINFRPRIEPGMFEINRQGAAVLEPADLLARAGRQVGFRPYRIAADTPFRLEAVRVVEFAQRRAIAQTYFGPGGRVSLFQTAGRVDRERLRRSAGRGLAAYAWSLDDTSLVLVGDLDETALRRLAGRVVR